MTILSSLQRIISPIISERTKFQLRREINPDCANILVKKNFKYRKLKARDNPISIIAGINFPALASKILRASVEFKFQPG